MALCAAVWAAVEAVVSGCCVSTSKRAPQVVPPNEYLERGTETEREKDTGGERRWIERGEWLRGVRGFREGESKRGDTEFKTD